MPSLFRLAPARPRSAGAALALLILAGFALIAPQAKSATIDSVFSGMASPPVSCTVKTAAATDGQRWCSASPSRVASWDGTPIDVSVTIPPESAAAADGTYPAIGIFHGWGGSKALPGNANVQSFVTRGYVVFSMTDRGWGQSCGTPDSRAGLPTWANCDHGYIHLDSQAYEVRDAQYLLGQLVEQGLVNPRQIGATGASYGGILAAQLGALKDRVRMQDGSLRQWTSPSGKPMRIAAATPQAFYTDAAQALVPNGSSLDYVSDAPYFGPFRDRRVGVQKQAVLNGFYNGGLANGFYAIKGTDPSADITGWRDATSPPGPFDNPFARAAVNELTAYHSAYYVSGSHTPAPMLMANGLWDDFVPADESVRYFNRIRSHHPGTPVALFFGDFGHARSDDKKDDQAALGDLQKRWLDYYVRGVGSKPASGLDTMVMTCPETAPSGGPYHFSSYADMERGELRVLSPAAQTIQPTGTHYGPELSGGSACATVADENNPATANYRTPAAPAGGFTVGGGATIAAHLAVTGQSDQIAARLFDVGTDGQQKLIERGLFRPQVNPGTSQQVFQLHPNVIHIDEGHVLKLELLPDDDPYSITNRTDSDAAAQHPIVVSDLDLRVPTIDAPGAAGGLITAPAPKILPRGYALASDFPACIVPRLGSRPVAQAAAALVSAGCVVGPISHRVSKKFRKGRVMSQGTRPGSRVSAGSLVSLAVSLGRPGRAQVVRRIVAVKHRRLALTLLCPRADGNPCHGALVLRTNGRHRMTLAKRALAIGAGRRRALTFRLTKGQAARLHRQLLTTAVVSVVWHDRVGGTTRSVIRIRG